MSGEVAAASAIAMGYASAFQAVSRHSDPVYRLGLGVVPWDTQAKPKPVFKDPRVAAVYDQLRDGGMFLAPEGLALKIINALDALALTEAFQLPPGVVA